MLFIIILMDLLNWKFIAIEGQLNVEICLRASCDQKIVCFTIIIGNFIMLMDSPGMHLN